MTEAAAPYQELKLAAKLFGKSPEALNSDERRRVRDAAGHQSRIESLILGAPEASGVVVPANAIDASIAEIRARFSTDEEFRRELDRAGLDDEALRHAVMCDMAVEAVLEKIGARAAAVSDTEVEIFWFMHRERFRQPEMRSLRHILVTINDALPGSERNAARARIDAIAARLRKEPERFAEQALKHSECPTALNGGLLGNLPRGRLYPELDAAGFALPAGGLSEVIESELGFHLVFCETIQPEQQLRLGEAAPRIRRHLETQRRSMCQKSWINALRRTAVGQQAARNRD